jgi:flagellar motor switch protein FliM
MSNGKAALLSGKDTVERLFQPPKLTLEQLPGLAAVFEGLAVTCTEHLREWVTTPLSLLVNGIELSSAWDVLESYEDCIAFIYYAPGWDARIVIGVDKRLVYYLLEAIFGGDGATAPFDDQRPLSNLEMRMAKEITKISVDAMRKEFAKISPTEFELERVETTIEFTMMGQSDFPVSVCQVLSQVLDHGGRMFIMMPQSALHQMRAKLQRGTGGSTTTADPVWTQRMGDGVARTMSHLEAYLEGPVLTVEQVANFKIGQVLEAKSGDFGGVVLECDGTPLFECKLGQSRGQMSLRLEKALDPAEQFLGEMILKSKQT